jgi:hypothetical protein
MKQLNQLQKADLITASANSMCCNLKLRWQTGVVRTKGQIPAENYALCKASNNFLPKLHFHSCTHILREKLFCQH